MGLHVLGEPLINVMLFSERSAILKRPFAPLATQLL
jgi:hypothetical protein